jgi:hypothetical protein
MQTIEIKTLLDITNTNILRPGQGSQLEHDQYRNFTTLKQCAELRSIISYDHNPSCETVDIKDLGFGSKYKGKHTVWTWTFYPDRVGVYSDNGNEIGLLINDIDGVPIVKKLTETINIDKAIFELKSSSATNTIIKAS